MPLKRRAIHLFTAVALACLGLVGCGDDDDAEGTAWRFLHASPDLPVVDVYLDEASKPIFTGVAYGSTTQFVPLNPSKSHTLHFREAGGSPDLPPLFTSTPFSVEKDTRTNSVAAGLVATGSLDKALRLVTLAEQFSASAPGRLRLRVLHAGADLPTLALDLNGDGAVDLTGLDLFEDSGSSGVEVSANQTLLLGFYSGDPRRQVTTFTLPPQQEGGELLVVATGLIAEAPRKPEGFGLLVSDKDGNVGRVQQNPLVYVLNASEAAGSLDVFLGETELAEELAFGELSSPIRVSLGVPSIDVFTTDPTPIRPNVSPLLSESTTGMMAGESYLLVAMGVVQPGTGPSTEPPLTLRRFTEGFAEDPQQPRLRLVHAAPSARAVDAAPLDPQGRMPATTVASALPYTQATEPEGAPVPPIEFYLGVQATADTQAEPISFFIGPGPLLGSGVFGVFSEGTTSAANLILVDTGTSPWSSRLLEPSEEGEGIQRNPTPGVSTPPDQGEPAPPDQGEPVPTNPSEPAPPDQGEPVPSP